jgi:hypothetical protein
MKSFAYDIFREVEVSLEEIYTGTVKQLIVRRRCDKKRASKMFEDLHMDLPVPRGVSNGHEFRYIGAGNYYDNGPGGHTENKIFRYKHVSGEIMSSAGHRKLL